MNEAPRRRGQPLLILVALLAGWVGGRAMSWGSLGAQASPGTGHGAAVARAAQGGTGAAALPMLSGPQSYQGEYPAGVESAFAERATAASPYGAPVVKGGAGVPGDACRGCASAAALAGAAPAGLAYMPMPNAREWGQSARAFAVGHDAGHKPSLRAGRGQRALPSAMARADYPALQPLVGLDSPPPSSPAETDGGSGTPLAGKHARRTAGRTPRLPRWSMDAWAFMRKGGKLQLRNGLLPATYGANQIGSVLRYRVSVTSALRPALYLRADSSTGVGRYATVAAGGSVRPLRRVPVSLAIEGRVLDDSAGRHIQPAVLGVTQFPRLELPYGLTGDVYAQGGWVGGRYSTLFADGQARVEHALFALGPLRAGIGAGLWGGVQKGASRIDAGPTLSLAFPVTHKVYARASIDWRMRVGGNAQPGSGPALTLSAGF